MSGALQSFLLAYSALFSIINPIGGAIIFSQVTAGRSHGERVVLARKIGIYSSLVMLGALWFGASILSFFGVSLAALRLAGGLVVASFAWTLLQTPERREELKQEQAAQAEGVDEIAFFPLTLPFTTGPGTISVAVALGANLPFGTPGYLAFVTGASAAALAMSASIWFAYASSDRLVALLGGSGARVVSRLAAFLLLCVGAQIMMNGAVDFLRGAGLAPS